MKRAAVLLFMFGAVAVARADLGPPPGKKVVPVTTTVDALEDFSDYAFFEVTIATRPGPRGGTSRAVTLHFFVPGSAINGRGSAGHGGTLYAVPRRAAERIAGWKDHAAEAAKNTPGKHATVSTSEEGWFDLAREVREGAVPGSAHVSFGSTEERHVTDRTDHINAHYRVTRTPTGVAFVRPAVSAPSGEIGKCGNDGPNRSFDGLPRSVPWGWLAIGATALVVFLVGSAGGVWWFLRRRA